MLEIEINQRVVSMSTSMPRWTITNEGLQGSKESIHTALQEVKSDSTKGKQSSVSVLSRTLPWGSSHSLFESVPGLSHSFLEAFSKMLFLINILLL